MKSFKKMVSEVAQPAKSKEEKAFKDMHSYETKSHPVAPDAVFTGDIGKPKASRKADQEGDINYDKQFKRESFDIAENVKASIAKSLSKSGESSKEGKKAVTLKKAPWEKNEATMTEQTCSCCDSNIDEDGKCACGSDCPECGGQHEVSEAGCGSSKKRNEEVEVQESVELDENRMLATAFHRVIKAHKYESDASGKNHTWPQGDRSTKIKHNGTHVVTYNQHDGSKVHKTPASLNKHLNALHDHEVDMKSVQESVELGEISKTKMGQYIKRAHSDKETQKKRANIFDKKGMDADKDKDMYNAFSKADRARKKAGNRTKFIGKAVDKLTKESVELDELSKKTLGSYIKKADKQADKAADSYSNAAMRRSDFAPDTPAMAKNAKKFIKRDSGADLARKKLAKESVELDEISQAKKDDYIKKSSADRQGAWSKKNIADRLRDKKTSAAMKIKMAKRDKGMSRAMGEELSPAQKKIDHNKNGRIDGKDLAALRAKKKNESVELDESVKTGNMKLKDGKTINVSKQDAMLLNQMMKDLNPKNRKEMQKVMMTDKAGFDEIVGFAREAL